MRDKAGSWEMKIFLVLKRGLGFKKSMLSTILVDSGGNVG